MTAQPPQQNGFYLRGREVSRLEGLSDAVFGFAITLLVVSLDVPRTATQLFEVMHGFGLVRGVVRAALSGMVEPVPLLSPAAG